MFVTTRAVAAILGDIPCVCGRGEGGGEEKEGNKKRGGEGGGRRDGDEEEEGKEARKECNKQVAKKLQADIIVKLKVNLMNPDLVAPCHISMHSRDVK